LEEKFSVELGGHTLLFSIHKCGNTKEECPPNSYLLKVLLFFEEKFLVKEGGRD